MVLGVLAACGDDGGSATIDAPSGIDAPSDVATDAPPAFDCNTPSTGTHTIFLSFEGVTLTRATSDAMLNNFAAVDASRTTATIPAWKAAALSRDMMIRTVTCTVREVLLPFDVKIVTTRPASGNYEMVVIGGGPADLGYNIGTSSAISLIGVPDCAHSNLRDVGWVAEFPAGGGSMSISLSPLETANSALAIVGIENGLAGVKQGRNCMCRVSSNEPVQCDDTQACQLTSTAPLAAGGSQCNVTGPTENQVAKLTARYGARP